LYVSTDQGTHWAKFESNLPTTLYDDLIIHTRDNDLIVATHGRSLWILDDLTPLAEWAGVARVNDAHLFSTTPATIFQYWKDTSYRGQAAFAGENPPVGALLSYYLPRAVRNASIRIANSAGETVRQFSVPSEGGIHRVTWDLRHAPLGQDFAAPSDAALPQPIGERGPFVSPGTYSVELSANGRSNSQQLIVRGDPDMPLTADQWRERESFLVDLQDTRRQIADASRAASEALRRLDTRSNSADVVRAIEQQLRTLRRSADNLAAGFNGNGARQGSLYGPTAGHRELKRRLDQSVEQLVAELDRAVRQ